MMLEWGGYKGAMVYRLGYVELGGGGSEQFGGGTGMNGR